MANNDCLFEIQSVRVGMKKREGERGLGGQYVGNARLIKIT